MHDHAMQPGQSVESLVGQVLDGRYRIDAQLGSGGMGAVFRAYHLGLHSDVAIKVLKPAMADDETVSKRFEREAQSASRLDHPNCVRVMDFGHLAGGGNYLVMQLLAGEELSLQLGEPWPSAEAVELALQILAGLDHAHHHGIVHRDLKPDNVFVTHDHRGQRCVKLVDFGIAKIVAGEGKDDQFTKIGSIFGTPRYMSPEQATGGKVDARTDLYAVGLLLYELLTGRPPFDSDDAATLLRMHILAVPPRLPAPIPPALAAVVARLLEKSRSDRYDDAGQVIQALQGVLPTLAGVPAIAAPPLPGDATVASAVPVAAASPEVRGGTVPSLPVSTVPRWPTPDVAAAPPVPAQHRPVRWHRWALLGVGALVALATALGLLFGRDEEPAPSRATSAPFGLRVPGTEPPRADPAGDADDGEAEEAEDDGEPAPKKGKKKRKGKGPPWSW